MKKQISIFALSTLLIGGLSGCNDFLDREPLDKVTPTDFFSSTQDLAAYTVKQYSFNTVTGNYGINLFGQDNNTDNQAGTGFPSFWIKGQTKVSSAEGDGQYKWENIRACNYFFDNVLPKYEAGEITGSSDQIKHYIGEMYVIRAYNYFTKLVKYGDLPIIETALQDNKDELLAASVRRPRHKVARFIIGDLVKAEELLMESAPGGKNRISRDVAYLLHARVALFEATWEKYHRGTAFVPGGKGWPGKDAEGYDADTEINFFLDEAIRTSKLIGDKVVGNLVENKDTREGMNNSLASINPYYTMFCDENMEGYSEILMWKRFDKGQGVVNNLQMELTRNGGGSGWTRGMVNSFLMRNGLPVYANNSGYSEEWEKQGVNKTLEGRDSRISIFTKMPGDVNFYKTDGTPDLCKIDFIFGDAQSLATTGFMVKKGKHYSPVMAQDHDAGTSGGIVFRATEAMLIYMEASYEKNRRVDETSDKYWRALRRRAKVNEDYNVTIAATQMAKEAEGDWGAYSKGVLIDETLYNIRRERRNELCAEAYRWDDLKRWRSMDQMANLPYRVEGMLYWGSVYEQQLKDKCIVDPKEGNMSSKELGNYILPYEKVTENNSIARQHGFLFETANYLTPISMATFRQTATNPSDFSTSVVYQNPGWDYQANTSAKPVE